MCKTCEWLKRNYNGIIPEINGFTDSDIIETISFILEKKGEFINDLSKVINKSIDSTVDLIYKLNLKHLHIQVKSDCEYCGADVVNPISVYLKNKNIYCSLECYWKDKPNKLPRGENSPYYNRIETTCTNCGKILKIIPWKYHEINKYGDNHNFCSQECYWEYRSKYYVGEKSSLQNYQWTNESRDRARIRLLERLERDDRLDTKIQLSINSILDNNNIQYTREKVFKYYAVDNYLSNINGIIEVMGDYWHTNPLTYNSDGRYINEMQQKQLHRDKLKHSYIQNHYDINILYLWETDIKNNQELCEELIRLYINKNKILPNYHSFNWEMIDGLIKLKEKIIIPYQDMKVDEYRNLIKKESRIIYYPPHLNKIILQNA
jgi:G:T-mismatch repair DNA endonuclease (very short patch repair protein)